MEQEIQDVSIKRIQEAMPQLKGIENELIIDYTEYTMPNDKHPIHRYPIRFDGLYIGLREKGKARFSINLKEFEVGHNDLVICSGDPTRRHSPGTIHGGFLTFSERNVHQPQQFHAFFCCSKRSTSLSLDRR